MTRVLTLIAATVLTICVVPWDAAAQTITDSCPDTTFLANTTVQPTVSVADKVEPWDIYLACRAVKQDDDSTLARLCALRLPVISRGFTATELREWKQVATSTPTPASIDAARIRAEEKLVTSARRVSTTVVGAREFAFAKDAATLPSSLQQLLQQHAANAKRAFDSDSQSVPVVGYADYTGNTPDSVSRALAKDRAEYVAGFLRHVGIPEDKIIIDTELVHVPAGSVDVGAPYRKASVGGAASNLDSSSAETSQRAVGLSPAELAIGASDFLMDRARAELETYVLRVGVHRLCTEQTWTSLLRTTCGLLPLKEDSVRYVPGVSTLQEALRIDLREMPYVVSEKALMKILAPGEAVTAQRAPAVLERAALAVMLVRYLRAVAEGSEPLAALAIWEDPIAQIGDQTLPVPVRVRRVATLARFTRSARTELSSQLTGPALADTAALYVLKALLVHGAHSTRNDLWHDWFQANHQQINSVLTGLRTANRVAQAVEDDWRAFRDAGRDSAAIARRAEIVANMLSTATSLVAVEIGSTNVQPDPFLRNTVLEPARDLVVALSSDNSRAVVTSLIRLLQAGADGKVERLPQEYTRLMGFANDAALARTTDEFGSALENLVGQQGGYLAKRESAPRWYARLNAYVGGNLSHEHIDGNLDSSRQGVAVGLTVPIGVELGKGRRSRRSNGLFLQFLDLGAVASARISGSDTVKSLPDFRLGSIVGPGAFWVHGYSDSPVASALGVSYFPEGRQISSGARVGVVRASMMVAIDIPIFP